MPPDSLLLLFSLKSVSHFRTQQYLILRIYNMMKVEELKAILNEMPNDANILLAINGHHNLTDTDSHGKAIIAHATMGEQYKEHVLVFSAASYAFNSAELNYINIKIVKLFNEHTVIF